MASSGEVDQPIPAFEDVLEHLGSTGRFQMTQIFMGILAMTITTVTALSFVFLGHEPPHVCNKINESQFLVSHGIPNETTTTFSYESCDIRVSTYQNGSDYDVTRMACPSGRNFSKAKHTTYLSEWDLVCESKGQAEIAYTVFSAGQLVGGISAAVMSDRFGRKPLFIAIGIFGFLSEAAVTLSANIYMVIAFRFFCGMCCQGFREVFFVHGMEFLLPRQRQVYGIVMCILYVFDNLFIGGIAYVFRDSHWRYTQGSVAAVGLFFIIYPFFLCESPRWLVAQGRHEEALRILKTGCKQNKVDFDKLKSAFNTFVIQKTSRKENQTLLANNEPRKKTDMTYVKAAEKSPKESFLTLLKYKKTRMIQLVACYTWFANSITYHGLFITSSILAGNRFLNYSLMAVVEIPSNLLILYMLDKFSRRKVLNTFLGLASLSLFLSTILLIFGESLEYSGTAFTTLFVLGKLFISASFNTIYIWTPELFPTNLRTTGGGVATGAARISSMVVAYARPLFSVIPWAPGLIFTMVCVINLFLTYFLPDTKGKNLPNSIEEMRNRSEKRARKRELSEDAIL